MCGRILAEFHLSGGKKVVVDFPVKALKVLFPVGVPGVLQAVREGVQTGNGGWWKIGIRFCHGCDLNAS